MRVFHLTCLLASFFCAQAIAAPLNAMYGLGTVEQIPFKSAETGNNYTLLVSLPEDYDATSDRTYPTIYLLDGGAIFPALAAYRRYLQLQESVPATIVVGLSYRTDDWRQGNARSTDYTAPTAEREHWGGAPKFQQALRTEIIPLVETRFRSNPSRRLLFGQSIAGQFVLYTAQTDPGLFWGHIASNPALHRNVEFFLGDECRMWRQATHICLLQARPRMKAAFADPQSAGWNTGMSSRERRGN